jgi:hypothetical protein
MGWGTFLAGQAIGASRRAKARKRNSKSYQAKVDREIANSIEGGRLLFQGLAKVFNIPMIDKDGNTVSSRKPKPSYTENNLSRDENGKIISKAARLANPPEVPFNFWTTLFLCVFFGFLGAHRFKVGRPSSGALMLVSFGGFGFWWAIDFLFIVTRTFTDGWGRTIRPAG